MAGISDSVAVIDGTAVVTGSAGFLGTAVIQALRHAGATAVGIDIRDPGAGDAAFTCDVTDSTALVGCLDHIAERHGQVTAFIHCAAINDAVEAWAQQTQPNPDSFLEVLRVNVVGTAIAIRSAADHMTAGGAILSISSLYAHVAPDPRVYQGIHCCPAPDKSLAYVASKAACTGIIKYLAVRYAGSGVRINGLAPGGIFNHQPAEFITPYASRTPAARMASVDEIAALAVLLVSSATSYMAGHIVVADGGYSAW